MQKLYYSIRETAELVDEEQHILRYWEKEFEELSPRKNRGGNRIYSEKDIKTIKYIKMLLRDEKLSIPGAKERLMDLLANKKESLDFKIDLSTNNQKSTFKNNIDGLDKTILISLRNDLVKLKEMVLQL